jgi:hypothetical protein
MVIVNFQDCLPGRVGEVRKREGSFLLFPASPLIGKAQTCKVPFSSDVALHPLAFHPIFFLILAFSFLILF